MQNWVFGLIVTAPAHEAPRFGPGVPMGPANLARAFANADREWSGTSVDAALRLSADWEPNAAPHLRPQDPRAQSG
jgi:hypothetical protein